MANPFGAFGMGMLGQLAGNMSNIYGTGAHLRRVRSREQLEQERLSFLGRVDAARAAGLHPLLAMGGGGFGGGNWQSGGMSSPMSFGGAGGGDDAESRRLRAAQADLAELQVAAARRALAGQAGHPAGGVQTPAERGQFKVEPASITSVAPNIPFQTAGPAEAMETQFAVRNPFTGEVMMGNLPSQKASEPLEGMGEGWKTILGLPIAGKFMWDTWVPDETKAQIFDMVERAIDNVGKELRRRKARRGGTLQSPDMERFLQQ